MKRKRLDRDSWGFQHFPYYQMRVDLPEFHGMVCLIRILSGEKCCWTLPRAGRVPVCGAGMTWLQLIPDLAMGTVYRNLTLFKQQGLVSSVATVSGVERFDGNTAPHVHFICTDCDAVIDLHQMNVPESLWATAEACCGVQVSGCQLSFTGVCRNCKTIKESGESA